MQSRQGTVPGSQNTEAGARSHSSDGGANPDACGARRHQDSELVPRGHGCGMEGLQHLALL